MRRDACDVDRSGCDVDEEQDVVGDEILERAHLDAQKVRRGQALPVSFEERRPSGMPVTFRGRFDAMFSQDVGDGTSSNLMSQIAQRAADSRTR